MTRSVKRSNNRKTKRSVKRGGSMKVGDLSANKASFAAKLGAFICENQALKNVVGDVNGFEQKVKGRAVNQRVFGVLPFLHLNISRQQFSNLMMSPKVNGSLVAAVEALCNSKNLNKTLKAVDFNCHKQSVVGVRDGLTAAIMESIENRWDMRTNGRKVLNQIQRVQVEQANKGKIPKASVAWCKC